MQRVLRVFTVSAITLVAGAAAAQTAPNNYGGAAPSAPPPNNPPPNAAPNSNATTPAAATTPDQPQGTAQPATPPPGAPVAAQPAQMAPPGTPPVAAAQPSPAPAQAVPPPPMAEGKVNPEAPLESGPVPVKGKWNPVLYGFVEFDAIHDSTESFSDLPGNGAIANPHGPNNYAGIHDRTMFAIRNSRIGFKLSAPETDGIKTTGILEMDFLGNQPSNPAPQGTAVSEGGFFTSPTFRVRHMALKLEDPYVDVLLGQYWQLFGWQSYFHPNTVTLQGVPGQVYSRAAQARLSHMFKSDPINFEIAVAASRPPQRDSGVPDGQAGIRLLVNDLKGVHTMGGTGTAIDAAGIGFSGVARRFRLPSYEYQPTTRRSTTGWGISTDVLIPIALGGKSIEDHGNNITLNGSWVLGRGIADLFTGLGDGNMLAYPLPGAPVPAAGAAPATYALYNNIDAGLVEFDSLGNPRAIRWRVLMGGIQYYLPPTGKVWVALNYSNMKSSNILDYLPDTAKANIYTKAEWYDANLFYDITVAARLGVEYAHYKQTYGDGTHRNNDHAQLSGWLIF